MTAQREQFERRAFLLFLVVVSLAFGAILWPFWGAIFWACAIVVIFAPLQQRLQQRWPHHPNTTAVLTLVLCMLVVIVPIGFISSAFIQEGMQFYQQLDSGEFDPRQIVQQLREAFPIIDKAMVEFGISGESVRQNLTAVVKSVSTFMARETWVIGQSTFGFVISLALMLYLAFFLLRDGEKLQQLIIQALPLGDAREHALLQKFSEVTRATVKGNLVVALVQGALGGIIFWLLAIPGPFLWGVVMALLSLIPAVGAALIWLPVSLYLYATGAWISATILIAYGTLVIGLADNVLRPLLVGRDTKLPDYVVLFSTIGGIALFGIHGFVIGPLVAALFMASWQIFMTDFNQHQ